MRKLDVGLLKKRIESRINADVNNKTVGGALVQVMQDDKVLYRGAFGSITPDGTDIVPFDTMFRMASMTKPITAAAILILAGKGKLKIDDPIDNYLPQYSDMNIGKVTESGNIMIIGNLPTTCFCGGAGLASTLDDYSAFAQMLVHSGRVGNLQIIAPELANAMRTPQLPHHVMPGPQVWGLGVRVITDDSYGRLPTGSFGWSGTYGTHFWVDPGNRISAVYLKNSLYDGGSGAVTAAHFEEDVTGSFQK